MQEDDERLSGAPQVAQRPHCVSVNDSFWLTRNSVSGIHLPKSHSTKLGLGQYQVSGLHAEGCDSSI
jgi:hypothetical protein